MLFRSHHSIFTSAHDAGAAFRDGWDALRAAIEARADDQLQSTSPDYSYAHAPMKDGLCVLGPPGLHRPATFFIARALNEIIHHSAQICTLRDLFAHRSVMPSRSVTDRRKDDLGKTLPGRLGDGHRCTLIIAILDRLRLNTERELVDPNRAATCGRQRLAHGCAVARQYADADFAGAGISTARSVGRMRCKRAAARGWSSCVGRRDGLREARLAAQHRQSGQLCGAAAEDDL